MEHVCRIRAYTQVYMRVALALEDCVHSYSCNRTREHSASTNYATACPRIVYIHREKYIIKQINANIHTYIHAYNTHVNIQKYIHVSQKSVKCLLKCTLKHNIVFKHPVVLI
jgi:hypothetical protein